MVRIGKNRQVGGVVLPRLPPRPELRKFPQAPLAPAGLQHGPTGIGMGIGQVSPAFVRPYHTLEMYGPGAPGIDISALQTRPPDTKLAPIPIRPAANRPRIPRATIRMAPKKIIVNPRPIIPPNPRPNLPKFPRLPEPAPMQMNVRPVIPPVRMADMGGPLSSTSVWNSSIGFSSGRTFEEAGKLY